MNDNPIKSIPPSLRKLESIYENIKYINQQINLKNII